MQRVKPLTIFAKRTILDVWRGSECASVMPHEKDWKPIT